MTLTDRTYAQLTELGTKAGGQYNNSKGADSHGERIFVLHLLLQVRSRSAPSV